MSSREAWRTATTSSPLPGGSPSGAGPAPALAVPWQLSAAASEGDCHVCGSFPCLERSGGR